MTFWPELGFRQSPYETTPITSDAEGKHLLVGREREVARLSRAVVTGTAHACLDGQNGVGKTSLVAVLAQLLREQRLATLSEPPFYPLRRPINITADTTPSILTEAAFFEIGQALLNCKDDLGPSLATPRLKQLDSWMNSPLFQATGGGASALGFGGSASRSASPNTTPGFVSSGFSALILDILDQHFPSRNNGGLVGVLENVELAGGPSEVLALLGDVRDPLFMLPGLRWVMCGADGVLRAAAASPRLASTASSRRP